MHSWTYIERRNRNPLPYQGMERRTYGGNAGPHTEEPILIQRAIAQDRAAFARLYDRYIDRIFKYICLLVGEHALAEDLTAQVFARAWQTLATYPHTERPLAVWLYQLAYNIVTSYGQRHRPSKPADARTPAPIDESVPHALNHLDEEQRQVLLLRFLEGYNAEQIAQITGQSADTIRTLQYHALVQLSAISRTP